MAGRRVVITGISSHWGAELARRLERDPRIEYLAGVDSRPPGIGLGRTEFIEADIRNPALSRLLPSTGADTIVHCGILLYPEPARPPRVLHEINVIGTLQLLAACERTETVRHVVVRGSAAIYGCEAGGPSFFTEDLARSRRMRTRFQRDISELEDYFDNFARRHGHLTCTMLRYQPEIGADLDTPLVGYLTLPVVPVQLGYDPRLSSCTPTMPPARWRRRSRSRSAGRSTSRPAARSRSVGCCGSSGVRRCRFPTSSSVR